MRDSKLTENNLETNFETTCSLINQYYVVVVVVVVLFFKEVLLLHIEPVFALTLCRYWVISNLRHVQRLSMYTSRI